MVPMRYHKLIFQTNQYNKIIVFILFSILILFSGCTKNEYPDPTNEFYVNDYARAFHPITRSEIVFEGERLYEETKDIEVIGGAQIVFATFIVDDVNEVSEYNRTDILRQWGIGKNDMGILVLMFFSESVRDGIEYIYLEETQIEVGFRMEQYLPAAKLGQILDNTIYSDTYSDLDMKVGYLFYELIKVVYEEVYVEYYSLFSYDMDDFEYALDNYVPIDDTPDLTLIAWILILLTGPDNWYVIVPVIFILIGGGIGIRRNRGGGGSSGGYGIFRRR